MTKILEITATTTDAEIEAAIPFLDMREYAKYGRNESSSGVHSLLLENDQVETPEEAVELWRGED